MRLWSINPKYLDRAALVALWREALLARAVLREATRGYTNHPQLLRFKSAADPLSAIDVYLSSVLDEARTRGYRFDETKIDGHLGHVKISVSSAQLDYEMSHLREKLLVRDWDRYRRLEDVTIVEPHPLFITVEGDIESWERVPKR